MVWLFRFCKRPNGMAGGISLLSLGLVVAEEECFIVASVVARSVGRAPSIPFGRKSHASTRQGTQATVRASSVSRGRAGQTESGTRKGTWVVEACVIRHCQRVSRGSVWPRTCKAFSAKHEARYGVAFPVLQTAKRNGGGVFVAFVVAGGRAVIIWRPYCGSAGHPCQQRRCLSFDSFDVNTLRRL